MNKKILSIILILLLCIGSFYVVYNNFNKPPTDYIEVIDEILDKSVDGIAVSIHDVSSLASQKSLILDVDTNTIYGKLRTWNNDDYLVGMATELLKEIVTLEEGVSNVNLNDKEFYLLDINMDFTKGTRADQPHSLTIYIDKETNNIHIPRVYDLEDKYSISYTNQYFFPASKELNELLDGLLRSVEGLYIESVEPTYSLDQDYGATMVSLEYASDDIVIFRGEFGLFVYSLANNELVRSVDLKTIDCQMIQGSEAAWLDVYNEGAKVAIYKANSDGMYIYHVEESYFTPSNYFESKDAILLKDTYEELGFVDELVSTNCVKFAEDDYGYLATEDYTLRTLKYVRGDQEYLLFKEED